MSINIETGKDQNRIPENKIYDAGHVEKNEEKREVKESPESSTLYQLILN